MADYPTSVTSFGFTAAAGKALPYDVVQRAMDEIVAIETQLLAAPTSYTPTWAASGSALTVGNATVSGRYTKKGKQVFFDIALTYGSTSAPGTGFWTFTLPSTSSSSTFGAFAARITDNGTQHYVGTGYLTSTTTVAVLNNGNVGSGVGAAVPMVWATGDVITVSGWYYES